MTRRREQGVDRGRRLGARSALGGQLGHGRLRGPPRHRDRRRVSGSSAPRRRARSSAAPSSRARRPRSSRARSCPTAPTPSCASKTRAKPTASSPSPCRSSTRPTCASEARTSCPARRCSGRGRSSAPPTWACSRRSGATVSLPDRPRVAISTGAELVEIDETPGPRAGVNSNAWVLAAAVARAGGLPSCCRSSATA